MLSMIVQSIFLMFYQARGTWYCKLEEPNVHVISMLKHETLPFVFSAS